MELIFNNNNNNRILLIISISSLLFSSSLLPSSAYDHVTKPRETKFSRPSQGIIPPLKTAPDHVPITPPPAYGDVKTPKLKSGPRVLPALNEICDKTPYPGLCIMTILPSLRSTVCSPAAALRVEIQACLSRTQSLLKKMGGASSSPDLKVFQQNYESAVEHLNVAAAAIAKHDVGTIKTRLTAAITNYSTCKGEFKLRAAFMVEQAVTLHKLASNCLAISPLL